MTREYVIECDKVSGDVWSPRGLFAYEGVNDQIIRCAACGLSGHDAHGGLTCDRYPESRHDTDPRGFCHAAIPREVP